MTVKYLGMGFKQPPPLLLAAVAGPAVDRLAALAATARLDIPLVQSHISAPRLMLPAPRYGVILADPPWKFHVWGRALGSRTAETHYPVLETSDLKRLSVQQHAADDCALFMWACWPTLVDAIALGESWGFEFKTCAFLWAKMNRSMANRFAVPEDDANWFMGMGYWTRANTEPCLLFTRGNPKRKENNVRQLIVSPIREHSRKPDQQYSYIERLVDGPYLELFARRKRQGWYSWGNEIVSDVPLTFAAPPAVQTAFAFAP